MSRATRVGSALAGLVLATGMLAGAPAAHAAATFPVSVSDSAFGPGLQEIVEGDSINFWLAPDAVLNHTVTSDQPGLFHDELDPAAPGPRRPFTVTFDTPGTYQYHCAYHGKPGGVGMSGVIEVAAAPEPTTTTTAPPTTTTTAPPTTTTTAPPTTTTTAPPTTTTRPAPTTTAPPATTTTRPPTTTAPTTATTARGDVKGASEPTATTKPKSTSTTKPKSTSTTKAKKKKKKSTTTTKPEAEETTTTVPALPSLAAGAPPLGAPDLPAPPGDIPDATESGEEASSWVGQEEGGRGGGNGKKLLIGLGGLGTLGLAGGGWRWYHRSSRYLPA